MGRLSAAVESKQFLWMVVVISVMGDFRSCVHCLRLTLERATSNKLLMEVFNESTSEIIWEYKGSRDVTWGDPPGTLQHLFNPSAYFIFGLEPNSEFYIRLRDNSTGSYSNEIHGYTCDELVPSMTNFRLADSGPGWLDIRWTRPEEKCKGFYYYYVRYKSVYAQDYTPVKTFGYFEISPAKAELLPSHPCNSSSDFCVLLTDHVVAGQEHTIELQAKRIGSTYQKSTTQHLNATANSSNFAPVDVKFCADNNSSPGNYSNEEEDDKSKDEGSGIPPVGGTTGIVLPVWAVALLGTLGSLTLVIIIGLWVKDSVRKPDSNEDLPRPPIASYVEEERYVTPIHLIKRSSKAVEYDDEPHLYEEIHTYRSSLAAAAIKSEKIEMNKSAFCKKDSLSARAEKET